MKRERKPALRVTEATRRQALSLVARAVSVAELVLRAEDASEPTRRSPTRERGGQMRVIAGRQSA